MLPCFFFLLFRFFTDLSLLFSFFTVCLHLAVRFLIFVFLLHFPLHYYFCVENIYVFQNNFLHLLFSLHHCSRVHVDVSSNFFFPQLCKMKVLNISHRLIMKKMMSKPVDYPSIKLHKESEIYIIRYYRFS